VKALLDKFENECPSEEKWLLYIVLNISGSTRVSPIILSNKPFLEYIANKLHNKQFTDEKFELAAKVVRNLSLQRSSTNDAHGILIETNIADAVMRGLEECSLTPICTVLTEVLYFLCTSKESIEWMESINGKQILNNILDTKSHPINDKMCEPAKAIVNDKLLTILDDIQDITVTGDGL